jgi:transglutaminase-like putative cysteine protease
VTAAAVPARAAAPRTRAERTLPVARARGLAFAALGGTAALHWMAMLEPAAPGIALAALVVASGAAGALLAAARRSGARRVAPAVLTAVLALALALVAAGVPVRLLWPAGWSELGAGVARGIDALPGVRVPYRGVEEWLRIVIPLGGTVLLVAAALLAFWPRRDRLGFRGPALALLVALYAVPAIALDFTAEFLRGALLALLVLAFLRLERLPRRDARAAGAVAAAVAFGGLLTAPLLDGDRPWWDYERWALETASAKTTAFSWDHRYGPLNWPRDGRELLRVRASRPAYWKVENLDGFDGRYWYQTDSSPNNSPNYPNNAGSLRDWTQSISVTVRNLRSDGFVTAGYASAVDSPSLATRTRGDGTFMPPRPLRRGDAYRATVYSPQPTERQRRAAPVGDSAPVWSQLRLLLPVFGEPDTVTSDRSLITFPRWGADDQLPRAAIDGSVHGSAAVARTALEEGSYSGVWRLVQELKQDARTQEDFVQRVEAHLGSGFSYSESPPPAAGTLPGFLLEAKSGYCQQFSGAMALMLRMGGVPARVATGFTSGALDSETREYVVRDLDAHSWVEVWYPGYGWVTFDPTPATAPPRSQPAEAAVGRQSGAGGRVPAFPGERGGIGSRTAAGQDASAPWWRIPLVALAVLGLALSAWWAVRRHGRPALGPLGELERALRRTHREPGPAATLQRLESSFAGTPAAGYVRAVREARYRGRRAAPTRSERRSLRQELARGAGLSGRLRAWWALPPRGLH